MSLTVQRLTSAAHMARLTASLLQRHEVENGLMLAVLSEAAASGADSSALWAAALDGDEAVAAVIRTASKALVSREAIPGASAALAEVVARDGASAVLGPPAETRALVNRVAELTGTVWGEGRRQRIYELRRVVAPTPPPGEWRVAAERDRELIIGWVAAFTMEALGEVPSEEEVRARWDARLDRGAVYLWEADGTPVSMAAAVGATPHGMRVGAVYTPPELRGRGYAGALVAMASQDLLNRGYEFTMLYTDLANPTSNAIYQRIGYVPVSDPLELRLEPGAQRDRD